MSFFLLLKGLVPFLDNELIIYYIFNFRSHSRVNVHRCGNIYYIFGHVHYVMVLRCQFFGHVHRLVIFIWSSWFGQVNNPLLSWWGLGYKRPYEFVNCILCGITKLKDYSFTLLAKKQKKFLFQNNLNFVNPSHGYLKFDKSQSLKWKKLTKKFVLEYNSSQIVDLLRL